MFSINHLRKNSQIWRLRLAQLLQQETATKQNGGCYMRARLGYQYLNSGWRAPVSQAALEAAERKISSEIRAAVEALGQQPAPACASQDCEHCPVRARCNEIWNHVEPAGELTKRTADCEITVTSAPTPTGFTGQRRDSRELPVVYDIAVGRSLPSLTTGTRLRLVDAVPVEGGKALEIRAWSECYLL